MIPFDPRIVPIKLDVAARVLEGQVNVPRFADARLCQVRIATAMMRKAPDPESEAVSQLLFGEPFDAYEESDGWVWGQSKVDGYVGYVRAEKLAAYAAGNSHRVGVARTLAFSRPSIKSPARMVLPLNAQIAAGEREDRFVYVSDAGWVIADHLRPLQSRDNDPAQWADLFRAAVYLWGGREPSGCDCSGLVQACFQASGLDCPRDSDMQEHQMGDYVSFGPNFSGLQRNDLVFWSGHVGLMLDSQTLLHANAAFMGITVEPLVVAADRISRTAGPVSCIKRVALGA